MTTTAEREADAPPDNHDVDASAEDVGVIHRAELATRNQKERVVYAYEKVPAPKTSARVRAFLEEHDARVGKTTLHEGMDLMRAANGDPDTGTMPKLTPERLAAEDARQARRNGFAPVAAVVVPVETEPESDVRSLVEFTPIELPEFGLPESGTESGPVEFAPESASRATELAEPGPQFSPAGPVEPESGSEFAVRPESGPVRGVHSRVE